MPPRHTREAILFLLMNPTSPPCEADPSTEFSFASLAKSSPLFKRARSAFARSWAMASCCAVSPAGCIRIWLSAHNIGVVELSRIAGVKLGQLFGSHNNLFIDGLIDKFRLSAETQTGSFGARPGPCSGWPGLRSFPRRSYSSSRILSSSTWTSASVTFVPLATAF